ncbi:hypothetical protein VOLCADRAFT_100758 [Volvox carteri f. nagariensis]|uniref:Uncharacterized protein n=1 Tax=Volvox carteri f. nagariensis TaxID=3068 RepID=D8UKY6_VOLCA|nr:uncharacterized protein VOLCADRAFT_100758 [Volvox carteri f. nagariensis]EFJ39617.1 hypothetical protein VOLCADRAFT_100758 [Volvox carteri f. nagariensis]|eukprot:XP_002959324.1 hypothetical protein VOLCADRAFT_100758 [Volvox carteri f. nagariensis]
MQLQSNWSAIGVGKGIHQWSLGSSQTSLQARVLLLPGASASLSHRPVRQAQLGIKSRLKSHQFFQLTSRVWSVAAAASSGSGSGRHNNNMVVMGGSLRGPEAQQAVATASAAAGVGTAMQQQQQQLPQQPQQLAAGPVSPSCISLSVSSGAVVAPDLDYTVVLDMLHKNAAANQDASHGGGVVLGLTSPVGPTDMLDVVIGQLNFKRLLACARNKLWWMTPEWRTASWALPPETQFLLAEMAAAGPYVVLLPLIDGDFRGTLRPPANPSSDVNTVKVPLELLTDISYIGYTVRDN